MHPTSCQRLLAAFPTALLATLLAGQQVPLTDAELDAAVLLYRESGLPEPPADASFVLLVGSGVLRGPGEPAPLYAAFRLPPTAGTNRIQHWIGTTIDDQNLLVAVADPIGKGFDEKAIVPVPFASCFERNDVLATGLQLWARGAKGPGRRIVQHSLPQGQTLEQATALLAFEHWHNQIVGSEVDLATIHARMQAAMVRHPALSTPANEQLLADLQLAATPAKQPTDALTALVLGLVHSRQPGGIGWYDVGDPHFDAVVRTGFAIVPALLAHLEDRRLTRSLTPGFNKSTTYIRPLGEVVGDALQQISGNSLPAQGLSAATVTPAAAAAAAAWWEQAQQQQEDEYLLACFLGGERRPASAGAQKILAAKFPERLELALIELVEQHLQRVTPTILDAIAGGSMRKQKKVELLERVAAGPIGQRNYALRCLAGVDEAAFAVILRQLLEAAPTQAPVSVWTSPAAGLGHLVLRTADPAVWQAFRRAAVRADVVLRMEFMNPFDYTYVGNRLRTERLALLASFLDDAEVNDVLASKQEGPHAAFTYRRLAMRDFAADKVASLLQLGVHGSPHWDEMQWADFRGKVRAALAAEGIQPMGASSGSAVVVPPAGAGR